MALQLRLGPPRWRRHGRLALAAGAGLVVLLVTVLAVRAARVAAPGGDVGARVQIERLRDIPAEHVRASATTARAVELTQGAALPALELPPAQPPVPFLDVHRVVSYYGNPLSPQMGIVGEHEPDELIRRLRAQAAVYQSLSPDRTVVPAIHFIYAVAQASAGRDGLYLLRMDDELVQTWVRITRDHGLLLFLDIQFGRSTIDREFPHVAPYLAEPHVHLALDPEFAWGPNEFPLQDIGHLDGEAVNRAQELLSQLVVDHSLPGKILVVHQFRRDMITNKAAIVPHERVELVIDADGFGSPAVKLDSWNTVIRDDNVQRAGIKLFYKQDAESGGLMSEADVMALIPTPVLIIYQ